MANPNIATHIPIVVVGTTSGNQESIQNYLEHSAETFNMGTPVELSSGYVIPWDGSTVVRGILGVALVGGLNYATSGAGASPLFGSIGFPGGTPTFGTVPNQSAAVNLLHGSLFANGLTIVAQAITDTIFEAQTDASSGSTFAPTNANIGVQYGLTADSNGYWYVDLAKSTVGTNTVLTIESINPQDLVSGSATTGINNARVRFKFTAASSQVNS